ncbi:sensor histidine kinase [Streptomyces justiciae]|uniref:sensor histidine kinase n=1 Tax=Streptomyces justiciae TaxID=2780140 RepID=UPI002119636F|nr:sensor histidine kinase [Streptomyces justiciae]MCW8380826.1 sensor histidine kinase [Streptomyces justiciae]
MSDLDAVPAHMSGRLSHVAARQLPHLVFFLVVGVALIRLIRLNIPLCWEIVTISGLLAATYAVGLASWTVLGSRGRALWAALLIGLWAALVLLAPPPFTGSYVWCALPLAVVALRTLGPRSVAVAVLAITAVLLGRLSHDAGGFDPELVLIPVAAVWGTVALYRTLQHTLAERQRLVEELRSTRDSLAEERHRTGVLEERARIARDLHDTLAQELSGSLMLLRAAERDWTERPDVAHTRVRAVVEGLDVGLGETRRIIRDLTPAPVTQAGLEDSLRLLCARAQLEGAAADVEFRTVGSQRPELDEETATAVFRVAHSMVANAREHAHASRLLVTLRHHPDHVELDVRDDGVGFAPADAGAPSRSGRGLGLPSARARLRERGGDLAVESRPGRGTRVRATVPTRRRPAAATAQPLTSAVPR